MAKFSSRLLFLRNRSKLTQLELADKLTSISDNIITRSAVGMWEAGKRVPKLEILEAIADLFNVDMSFLLGKSDIENIYSLLEDTGITSIPNIIPMPKMRKIPLIGNIACGSPIVAEENIECEVNLPEHVHADFALRCKGDSMINARIYDGDIVYIRQMPIVNDGEIAAVEIDDEATLKRVRLFKDHIVLEAENPLYKPIVYWGEDMNSVHILGKATHFTSLVR